MLLRPVHGLMPDKLSSCYDNRAMKSCTDQISLHTITNLLEDSFLSLITKFELDSISANL